MAACKPGKNPTPRPRPARRPARAHYTARRWVGPINSGGIRSDQLILRKHCRVTQLEEPAEGEGEATRRPGRAGPTSLGGVATRHNAAAPARGGPTRAVGSLGANGASRRRWGGGAASEEETPKTSAEAVS